MLCIKVAVAVVVSMEIMEMAAETLIAVIIEWAVVVAAEEAEVVVVDFRGLAVTETMEIIMEMGTCPSKTT